MSDTHRSRHASTEAYNLCLQVGERAGLDVLYVCGHRERDLLHDPDGQPLNWPPQYVDLADGGTLHDWDDLVPPEASGEPTGERITWRQLAWDIADEYGGIDDLLSRMWLHLGGEPPGEEPQASVRPGGKTCEGCGQRPGQIMSNVDGWLGWPCYEDLEDG